MKVFIICIIFLKINMNVLFKNVFDTFRKNCIFVLLLLTMKIYELLTSDWVFKEEYSINISLPFNMHFDSDLYFVSVDFSRIPIRNKYLLEFRNILANILIQNFYTIRYGSIIILFNITSEYLFLIDLRLFHAHIHPVISYITDGHGKITPIDFTDNSIYNKLLTIHNYITEM